jgi:hypothetical protein
MLYTTAQKHARCRSADSRACYFATSALSPECLSRASGAGSLPRKALKTSAGCLPPPRASTVLR